MANEAAALSLDDVIKKLSSLPVEADKQIFSLYIQSHGQNLAQRKGVRVFLDKMLRSPDVEALRARDRSWAGKLKQIAVQADHCLNAKDKAAYHGIAFFAAWSEEEPIQFASYLPFPNSYQILNIPALGPLVGLRDDYDPLCLCHFNGEEAHVLEIQNGALAAEHELGNEVYPHHKQGGWSQARFQRKHNESIDIFFREIARRLDQIAIRK